jgi:hypothetical protein
MQQEFDAELRIEKIEINPFVLRLRITGLELDNPEGAPTIRVQEIFTNFQLSSLFRLAYASELRAQLVALQTITEQDLTTLASARSMALKTALVAIDESLQERVSITDNLAVTREQGALVKMAVTLGSKSE